MTLAELFTALKTLGLPVAYAEFTQPTAPPFICYQFTYSGDNLVADNANVIDVDNIDIELYTVTKDLAREKLVEDKLKELELPYRKVETLIESENLRQVIYEIQIVGG